jgi:hypothetical protein
MTWTCAARSAMPVLRQQYAADQSDHLVVDQDNRFRKAADRPARVST